MNCKYLKLRSKKYIKYYYCSFYKKNIIFTDCHNCISKCYKDYKPIVKRTKTLNIREKRRFSIIYTNFNKCVKCGCLNTQINEVFDGAYRQLSIKYGCCCAFCDNCHKRFHLDRDFALYYKIMFQDKLVEIFGFDWYISKFKINYHFFEK